METRKKYSSLEKVDALETQIYSCKPASLSDIEKIKQLVTQFTNELFGDCCIETLIKEKQCLCLHKSSEELGMFIAFSYSPNIPVLPDFKWEQWLKKLYRLTNITSWNSIFIHYLVCSVDGISYMPYILRSMYKDNIFLKHVLLTAPPNINIDGFFGSLFTKVIQMSEEKPDKCQSLYIHNRHKSISKLMIHKATEEENADYIQIIEQNSPLLVNKYGKDFFGDLIAAYSGLEKTFLAAEKVKGFCVGIMSLAPVNSYDLIIHHFDVRPYHGFCKPEEEEEKIEFKFFCSESQNSISNSLENINLVEVINPKIEFDDSSPHYESNTDTIDTVKSTFIFQDEGVEFQIIDDFVTKFIDDFITIKTHFSVYQIAPQHYASHLVNLEDIDKDATDFWTFSLARNIARQSINKKMSLPEINDSPSIKSPPLCIGNAFLIEIFAMDPNIDGRCSHDLLEAAFECFPTKDYCLLTQPSKYSTFPLIQYFTRVVTNQKKSFPHELYFIHRNGVFANFSVRCAHISDFKIIAAIISHVHNSELILNDLLLALTTSSNKSSLSYVFLSENSIVGFTVITPEYITNYLKAFYNIQDLMDNFHYQNKSNGLIMHFLLSPIFLKFSSFFLRETLRLSSLKGLFYILHPLTNQLFPLDFSLVSVLGEMIAIQPIHPIQYDMESLGKYAPNEEYIKMEPLALYYVNEKITLTKKLEITSKIVIVGGSDTAMAFIESLLFRNSRKHYVYTNITLVAKNGLPNEMQPHQVRDAMFQQRSKYKHEYINKLGLRTYVNIVYGMMTEINRTDKYIVIDDEDNIYYEYLFLFTGLQYQIPLQRNLRKLYSNPNYCRKNIDRSHLCSYLSNFPNNLFLMNSQIDATKALRFIKECFDEMKLTGKLIVYGSGIGPQNCINSLLMFGVPALKIVYVSADIANKPNCFNNNDVHHFVISHLLDLKVHTYGPYEFHSWCLNKDNLINSVTFVHLNEEINIDCLGLFCFEERITSPETFNAVLKSGLVYNGHIVIDRNFTTNDQSILAAGPATKYSSEYYAEDHMHKYYDSTEIGETVADYFCKKLEGEYQELKSDDGRGLKSALFIRRMVAPKSVLCKIPFGLNYLHIYPGGKLRSEVGHNKRRTLTTGLPLIPQKKKYFCLVLNNKGYITELTCVTQKEILDHNYFHLIGKHERLLNNLVDRYENNYIDDFFTYFSQPWTYVIYDKNFTMLLKKINEIYEEAVSVLNKIKDDYDIVEESERQFIRMLIMKELMSFIDERCSYLPMYVNQDYIKPLEYLWEKSPVYKPDERILIRSLKENQILSESSSAFTDTTSSTEESIEEQSRENTNESYSFTSDEGSMGDFYYSKSDEETLKQSECNSGKKKSKENYCATEGETIEEEKIEEETIEEETIEEETIEESNLYASEEPIDIISSLSNKEIKERLASYTNIASISPNEKSSESLQSNIFMDEIEMVKNIKINSESDMLDFFKLIVKKLNLSNKHE
uniref:Uncharacterized protein n=1 Tax=Clastoptera arizonana TaxID=38151 RepID=A0A1B6DB85_9HEMI